jgi:hypothetical protein
VTGTLTKEGGETVTGKSWEAPTVGSRFLFYDDSGGLIVTSKVTSFSRRKYPDWKNATGFERGRWPTWEFCTKSGSTYWFVECPTDPVQTSLDRRGG